MFRVRVVTKNERFCSEQKHPTKHVQTSLKLEVLGFQHRHDKITEKLKLDALENFFSVFT